MVSPYLSGGVDKTRTSSRLQLSPRRWLGRSRPFSVMAAVLIFTFCGFMQTVTTKQTTAKRAANNQAWLAKVATQSKNSEVRLAAVKKLTDQAVLATVAVKDEDSDVREAAVKKLTDQELLFKVAIEFMMVDMKNDKFRYFLQAVVDKLTDQGLLAKVAIETKNQYPWYVCAIVNKITDQGLLAKVAIYDMFSYARAAAVEKLTDQAVLAKVAVEDMNSGVRKAAVEKLTDQTALARVAIKDEDPNLRAAAVKKLTDQTALAKVAINDEFSDVRAAAVEKLTDQLVLVSVALIDVEESVCGAAAKKLTDQAMKIKFCPSINSPAELCLDWCYRTYHIGLLSESDPIIRIMAADLGSVVHDARHVIARIKLATQEPLIKSRLPGLRCIANTFAIYQRYGTGLLNDNYEKKGESVTFDLVQNGRTLPTMKWETGFPDSINTWAEPKFAFVKAYVRGEDLLKELLHLSVFTQEDLDELAHSSIPEVRIAAVSNLGNHALLEKVATDDKCKDVRDAAKKRLDELRGHPLTQ